MKKFTEDEIKALMNKAFGLIPDSDYEDDVQQRQVMASWYGPMAAEIFRVLVEQERGVSFVIR